MVTNKHIVGWESWWRWRPLFVNNLHWQHYDPLFIVLNHEPHVSAKKGLGNGLGVKWRCFGIAHALPRLAFQIRRFLSLCLPPLPLKVDVQSSQCER